VPYFTLTPQYADTSGGGFAGNTLRRVEVTSKEAGVSDYLFCSNSKSSSTTFGSPTLFGAITYSIVSNDPKAISQMDKIISSLKAVQ